MALFQIEVALDLVDNLAAFVQRTDQRVELSARHVQPARSSHPADFPDALNRGSLITGHDVQLDTVPTILLLSWFGPQLIERNRGAGAHDESAEGGA